MIHRVAFQLHSVHTVLQSFRRIELFEHTIYTLPYLSYQVRLSQVKHVKVKCFAKGTQTFKQGRNVVRRERNIIFIWKTQLPQVGIEPVWQAVAIPKRHAQTIVPRPSLSESTASSIEVGCYLISANIFLMRLLLTFWCIFANNTSIKNRHSTGMSEYSIQNIYDNSIKILLCCLRCMQQNAYICCCEQAKFQLLVILKQWFSEAVCNICFLISIKNNLLLFYDSTIGESESDLNKFPPVL